MSGFADLPRIRRALESDAESALLRIRSLANGEEPGRLENIARIADEACRGHPDLRSDARTLLGLLDRAMAKVESLRRFHGKTRKCLASGKDDECGICAVLDCPHDEPFHFHHDGCPACSRDPFCELQAHPEVEPPDACYDEATYPFIQREDHEKEAR